MYIGHKYKAGKIQAPAEENNVGGVISLWHDARSCQDAHLIYVHNFEHGRI